MNGRRPLRREVWREPRCKVRTDRESGAVALFSAVAVFALLVTIGLVVDGGSKIRGLQRADTLAAEAARTGAQAIEIGADGANPTINVAQACAAVRTYLAGADVQSYDCRPVNSTTVQVNVVTSSDTVFLSLIGRPTWQASGSAQVRIARGVGSEL